MVLPYTPLSGSTILEAGTPLANENSLLSTLSNLASGPIFIDPSTHTSTAVTAETTLSSYSLPANFLASVGQGVRITARFQAGATSNNKTFKLYFGSEVISSGVLTTNNKNGSAEMIALKTGAGTQIVSANMLVDTTPITGYNTTGAESDTAAITIKFTGTDGTGATGNIVLTTFMVEALR